LQWLIGTAMFTRRILTLDASLIATAGRFALNI
jgi:hypothetical protein